MTAQTSQRLDGALAVLIDQRRDLAAKTAGKDIEIAMALGDRDAAQRALAEMLCHIEARRAAWAACYFDVTGERDAAVMKAAHG